MYEPFEDHFNATLPGVPGRPKLKISIEPWRELNAPVHFAQARRR